LTLFATVAVVGIQTLGKGRLHRHRNLIIVTTSLALALWVTSYPDVAQGMRPASTSCSAAASPSAVAPSSSTSSSSTSAARPPRRRRRHHHPRRGQLHDQGALHRRVRPRRPGSSLAIDRAFEQRPYADTNALAQAFQDGVLTGSSDQQLELINAFPDLGAEDETAKPWPSITSRCRTSTKKITTTSFKLSTAYRDHFGFPLVICAARPRTSTACLRNGWSRMDNSAGRREGLRSHRNRQDRNYRFESLVATPTDRRSPFGRLDELT